LSNDSRSVELESKISHQEFVIETLVRQVQEQGMAIYHLEAKLTAMEKKVIDLGEAFEGGAPVNQKPPHY